MGEEHDFQLYRFLRQSTLCSICIYLVPVITVITSALILHEGITVMSGAGTILALAGLFLSEYRGKHKNK